MKDIPNVFSHQTQVTLKLSCNYPFSIISNSEILRMPSVNRVNAAFAPSFYSLTQGLYDNLTLRLTKLGWFVSIGMKNDVTWKELTSILTSLARDDLRFQITSKLA